MSKLKAKKILGKAALILLLCFVAIIMVLPFYWSVLTSLRPDKEIFKIPIEWLPKSITFDHYRRVFEVFPFFKYFCNTLIITVSGLLSNLLFGSLAGYAFAKLSFKGRNLIFKLMLMTLMLPGVVILIPQFLVLKNFPLAGGNNLFGQGGTGFIDSFLGVILPGAIGVYGIFFMRQFFLTLPNDLGESARVEGAGECTIFARVYLPLVKPALASLAIFGFQGGWNNFLWPNIILQDPDKKVLTMGLQAFTFNNYAEYGPMMAASVLICIPVFLVFIFFQKYFVQGVALSGMKE